MNEPTDTPAPFRVTAPGIYEMTAEQYHADPCPIPSLSSSIASCLCSLTPAHARHKHPRLNPYLVPDEAEHFDIGTTAHAILLEGRDIVEVLDFPDWRTNAAKDARDAARAKGKTPLLRKIWTDVDAMVRAARIQLEYHTEGYLMFQHGHPERVLVWEEPSGVWCRARLDWLRPPSEHGPGAVDDYKTTSATANPEVLSRTAFVNGWDMQVAFYLRGVWALTNEPADFRFAVQECYAPYALSVLSLGPSAMTLAQKKLEWALELWADCLERDRWPTYGFRTAYITTPPWVEEAWLQKEVEHAV